MKPQISSVLYLVPDLIGPPGGIARYCRLVCESLLNSRFDVTTVSLMDRSDAITQASLLFPNMSYSCHSGSRVQFGVTAFRQSIQHQPQLILVGHPHFAGLGYAIHKLIQAPMIVFTYGVDVWRRLPVLVRYALQQSERIISISQFTADIAVKCNTLNPQKIRILHNCLDPKFEQTSCRNIDTSRRSLLTVARITPLEQYKGHDRVLHSLPHLLKIFPDLIYDVVGDGEGRAALEQLATDLGVANAVRFHGIVSDERLRELYAQASIFIMPSAREGFGFVFLEAMVNGLPIVAGNQDATPEVVIDGENGLLVNPSATNEIIGAVTHLLSNDELRLHLGEAGIQRVRQKFSFAQFQNTLSEIFTELE